MHQPPPWVLDGSERLALDGFLESFGGAWADRSALPQAGMLAVVP